MLTQALYQKVGRQLLKNVNKIPACSRRDELSTSSTALFWKKKEEIVLIDGSAGCPREPLLTPCCKNALVIGGSDMGYGFFAADRLLYYGAKKVIIADNKAELGAYATDRLCRLYGKGRAAFYCCDLTNSCHLKGVFQTCHFKNDRISIIFNDIDAVQDQPESRQKLCNTPCRINDTERLTRLAFDNLRGNKEDKQWSGVIINCASILGFVGWPDNPEPIYCRKEPIIEMSVVLVNEYPASQTGIRLLNLCPCNRTFDMIGLPDFPDNTVANDISYPPWSCTPDPSRDKTRLGISLAHVMAYGSTGSVWTMQPPFTLSEVPKLVEYYQRKKS